MNPTIALTLILLFLMIAAGIVSGTWGYAVGREALKGITQPDVRPVGTFANPGSAPRREQAPLILKESEILADVKARMEGRTRSAEVAINPTASPAAASPAGAIASPVSTASNPEASPSAEPAVAASPAPPNGFPLVSQDQGVTLEVASVRQEDGLFVLEIKLQNSSSRAVNFLYSFMNVTDEQGNPFSANTQGLPADLPANGETFTGTVSVPLALLDGSESLSLSLTDYPEQKLRLNLANIPITR